MRQKIERGFICLGLVWLLAACGGGSGSATPAVTATPTIGASGGTVTEASGASVIVPVGALATATTIRVAMDSTGAPALPDGLVAAGNTYMVTPHGGAFAQPVEVRIPAPNVTLLPTQELKLAKAEPGGEWVVLGDSVLVDGVLSAKVDSFSYFMPVVVSYLVPFVDVPPLRLDTSLSCGSQPCSAVLGKVTATYTVTTNSGYFPANCANGSLRIQHGYYNYFTDFYGVEKAIPLSGGSASIDLDEATVLHPYYYFVVGLVCNGQRRPFNDAINYRRSVYWATNVARVAPIIFTEPRAMLVMAGQTASLNTLVRGVPAPSLIWQSRPANSNGAWADVSNATATTTGNYLTNITGNYTTPVLTLANNGIQYRVKAVNDRGFAVSAIVTVSVNDFAIPPSITTEPASLNVISGSDAAFAIAASGTDALSYQWRRNGVAIKGANSPLLLLAAVDNKDAGSYSVDVSNSAGAVSSNAATLVVTAGAPAVALPSIVTQPAALIVSSGDSATFAVGSNAASFQWRKDGVNIASATTAALTLSNVSAADVGVYSVVVSNSAGSVTSGNASLTITTAPAPVITAPVITTQPATLVVLPGAATTLAVAASGTGPLTYQWSINGAPISGATGAVLYLPSVSSLDAGNYTVSVGNSAGSAGSNAAQLILVGAPTISAQPGNASAFVGATATFSVTSSGNSPLYQWTRNNVAITGATSASYTTPTLALSDNGAVYGVIVYNGAGLVFSQGAVLTVTPLVAPSFSLQAANQSVVAPAAASFTVAAGGSPAPSLQWQLSSDGGSSWTDISGANSASYTTPATSVADSGRQYRVVASNSAGNVSSAAATLTVAAVAPPTASWQTAGLIEVDNVGEALGPQAAFNSAGDGMAVWYQFDGTRYNIWANHYVASTGWGTATLIEADPGDAGVPQVAIDANGNAMAVWQQRDVNGRNNIWANRYLASTGWGTPTAIETNGPSAGDDQLPRIAMDANGNVIVVWELSSFSSTTIWANRFVPGAGWGAAIQIGSGNPNSNHVWPQVAVDAVGNAFVVWPQYNGRITNIWGNRFSTGTGWGTAALVQSDSASSGRDPKIAADANGNAMLVWAQFDLTSSTDHIWASRYLAGTGWGTATLIQTNNASHQANLPKIAFDAGGNAIAVWNQGAFGSFSVYAARYVAGLGWGTESVIETHTTGSSAASVSLGVDNGGNAIALWQLTDPSSFADVWATRFTAGTGWGVATPIEPANVRTGQAYYPQVAMNGNGQAIAVWQRRNPTRFDIWANTYR